MTLRSTRKSSQEGKEGGKGGLAFSEEFESATESAEVDRLLKFESKRGGRRFDFEGVDPDHPAAGPKGEGRDSEKFLEKPTEVGDRDAFAERWVGDDQRNAAGAIAWNFFELAKVAKNEIGRNAGELGGVPVCAGGLDGIGGQVVPQNSADSG
jgi:hypothetical protein